MSKNQVHLFLELFVTQNIPLLELLSYSPVMNTTAHVFWNLVVNLSIKVQLRYYSLLSIPNISLSRITKDLQEFYMKGM